MGRLASFSLKLLYLRQIWTKLKNFCGYNQAFLFVHLMRSFIQQKWEKKLVYRGKNSQNLEI